MGSRGTVVITGASSGIGRATALTLARAGWHVFAGVRREADGAALAADAGAIGVGALVRPLPLDVTDEASITRAVVAVRDELGADGGRLVGLVNNAGIAGAGPIEEVSLGRFREVLAVNVLGVVAVTQAFLPLLRQSRGRIVNVSSVSGRAAPPFLGPYAASKFALEALSDALRVELRPWGIKVIVVEPGPIATPIWEKGETAALADRESRAGSPYAPYLDRVLGLFRGAAARGFPPERVAATIARALAVPRPRARYLVTRNALGFALFARLAPESLRDGLFALAMLRVSRRAPRKAKRGG
jgi:NAD(P)-dependent dehydrogenase (short-subunit alcohol dehydrogenase family)